MAHLHRPHRISRRGFLTDLGKGTVAVTILGTAFVACGYDDSGAGATSSTTSNTGPGDEPAPSNGADASGEMLRFERASFDFVSAYVLVRGTNAAVVDTGTGDLAPIEAALTAVDSGFDQVSDVVVTHLHGDHVGGLDALGGAAGAASFHAGAADIDGIATSVSLSPVGDGDEVFGLQVIATPGHTAGHVSVFDPESGILVAGDALNLSSGSLAGSAPEFTADAAAADASVGKLAVLDVQAILAGHGDPLTERAGPALDTLSA